MQSVAVQTIKVQPVKTRTNIQWVKPLPLWAAGQADVRQPRLVKLTGDNFLPDFLAALGGQLLPGQTPGGYLDSAERGFNAPEDSADGVLKLYQPAHGRFYLVTASLICMQAGLPDRRVNRSQGERTHFVVRRMKDGVEQGWVDDGPRRGWQPLVDLHGRSMAVLADEERLPLHPASAAPVTPPGNTAIADPVALALSAERTVYYGYIPTGNREKYAERYRPVATDPAAAVQSFVSDVRAAAPGAEGGYDFRLDQIDTRVIGPWRNLYTATDPATQNLSAAQKAQLSLYLILDLDDFLQRALPDVFAALGTGGAGLTGANKALFDELDGITVPAPDPNNPVKLTAALNARKADIPLVDGQGDEPTVQYDMKAARHAGTPVDARYLASNASGPLYKTLSDALKATPISTYKVPQEVSDLLQDQVRVDGAANPATGQDTYFLRLVYDYPPCPPVVSDPSPSFTLARFFDPDAPARHIRIELPSIAMKDLRKYRKGVGLQMSPQLRDLMGRVNKGMLKGDSLDPSPGGFDLGMICSFSLQIIFLVAFIVMFIFLIALNFVFWWLPFLKICFPIPRKSA